MTPFLELRDIHVTLGARRRAVQAVAGVSLAVGAGEIVGLAGESGCGKTTLARTILGLQREDRGEVRLDGVRVSGVAPRRARLLRRAVQYVHQDPGAALDPWWTLGRSVEEALVIAGQARGRRERAAAALADVGLDPAIARRLPHEVSGGQLRRIGLARILVLAPRLVILDEPTSGLDLSIQATILSLLLTLRERLGLSYLFISHDLGALRLICDRVAVMYAGRIVETAPAARLFARPLHPYTRALLAAAPSLDPDRRMPPPLPGEPPGGGRQGPGCVFAPRCAHALDRCRAEDQVLQDADCGQVACWRWPALDPALTQPAAESSLPT